MRFKSGVLAAAVCGGIALAAAGLGTWAKSQATAAEPALQAGGDASDRAKAESINHLKLIMLAFHNYVSLNGHFPPSGIPGRDGQPRLSWRVALLPFLGHQELYEAFHLDEPWDSPHNKALILRMPEIFTTPSSPTGPGATRIRGFDGPGTMFDSTEGVKIQEITDGTWNTIMVAAAREPVPWTRPGELPFAGGKPVSGLDDSDDVVLIGVVDGTVHYVPHGDQDLLTKLITRAGGEVLVWPAASKIHQAPRTGPSQPTPAPTPTVTRLARQFVSPADATQPAPAATAPSRPTATNRAGPASSISPELEERLRAIEAKLDRLLRKLGADEQTEPR